MRILETKIRARSDAIKNMKKHNLAFIDVETTGLNVEKHEIIEIGGVIVRQGKDKDKLSFEIIEEFDFKIKPRQIETADPKALRINGYNKAAWTFAYDLQEIMPVVSQKTANSIMVAHNLAFDFCFLNKAFREAGVENKMHYHKLDTVSIAFAKLYHQDNVDRFSLGSLCEYFGIENKNTHTALSDARATFNLYEKLMRL